MPLAARAVRGRRRARDRAREPFEAEARVSLVTAEMVTPARADHRRRHESLRRARRVRAPGREPGRGRARLRPHGRAARRTSQRRARRTRGWLGATVTSSRISIVSPISSTRLHGGKKGTSAPSREHGKETPAWPTLRARFRRAPIPTCSSVPVFAGRVLGPGADAGRRRDRRHAGRVHGGDRLRRQARRRARGPDRRSTGCTRRVARRRRRPGDVRRRRAAPRRRVARPPRREGRRASRRRCSTRSRPTSIAAAAAQALAEGLGLGNYQFLRYKSDAKASRLAYVVVIGRAERESAGRARARHAGGGRGRPGHATSSTSPRPRSRRPTSPSWRGRSHADRA